MNLKVRCGDFFLIFSILLFAIALNFMQIGIYILVIVFFLAVIIKGQGGSSFKIDKEFAVLILATFSYVFFYRVYAQIGIYTVMFYLIGPITSYFIGRVFVNGNENYLKAVVIVIALGMSIHALLNLISSNILTGISERYVIDYWTDTRLSATLQGTLLAFGLASVFWLLLSKKIQLKIIGVFVILFTLWNCFMTATRTPLYLLVLQLVVLAFYKAAISKERQQLKKTVNVVVKIFFVVFAIILVYTFNVLGIKDIFLGSSLFLRFQMLENIIEDTRIDHVIRVAAELIKHPMGNIDNYTGVVSYAHNFWLDIGRQVGIIPMILFAVFSVLTVKKYFFITKRELVGNDTRILLTGVYLSMGVFCFLEPLMEGNPWLFYMMCVVSGGIASIKKLLLRK